MSKLTEDEIDKKFRELLAIINAQSPDRLTKLREYLDEEVKQDGSDKVREMPKTWKE